MSVEQHGRQPTQYELRATAVDPRLDQILQDMTQDEKKYDLPGFLYLFSRQRYLHTVDDMFDGVSVKERDLAAYRLQVGKLDKRSFSLDNQVTSRTAKKDGRLFTLVNMRLELGDAAHQVIAPPFFQLQSDTSMDIYYVVPDATDIATTDEGLDDLKDYLSTHPKGVIDELIVIKSAARHAAYASRSRVRERPKEPDESDTAA